MTEILVGAVALLAGLAGGYLVRQNIVSKKAGSIEAKATEELNKAKSEAQKIVLEAQNKALSVIEEAKKEEKERKSNIDKQEARVVTREDDLSKKEKELSGEKQKLSSEAAKLQSKAEEVDKIQAEATTKLSKIAGLTPEQAKEKLIKDIEERHKEELASTLFKLFHERHEEIEKKSKEIMTTAVQRYSRDVIADITTSVFTLPSEDLKGKIIGREGRNIRTLERLAGVEFVIDESPETIVISSFDPYRREVASMALSKLIKDGRIQPAKIEEKVDEAKAELDKRMFEIGEEAAHELGIFNFAKEIVQLLGRLNFRTSFGQNVLTHSVETAHLAGMIAAELGANVDVAKRGALVHDIGKAIDHEVEGTHVDLGRKILKKYGVQEEVIRAMEAHHEEYPFSTPESFIVAAADALSAARPGARRGTMENYIKRLQDLEAVAMTFKGVKQAYAIAAGRELRVFVIPEQIDDFRALQMAKDIANKIEAELKYPGEVKVNVIREIRAVEFAK